MTKLDRETFVYKAIELGRNESLITVGENYINNLEEHGLPIIFSTKHLSLLIGVPNDQIGKIISNRNDFYRNVYLKKKNGEFRLINAPNKVLRDIQKWINLFILEKVPVSDYVTSYKKGKSIKLNAEIHINSHFLLKVDLKSFFYTIDLRATYKVFRHLGYPKSISIDLAKLCTIPQKDGAKSYLPQGAPTSPHISNIIGFELDRRLAGYALKCGFRYSRYSDDLTFSTSHSDKKISYDIIKNIIRSCGFFVNEKKTCFLGKSNRQEVTGLNVNSGVTIAKIKRRTIETHIHNCLKNGVKYHMEKANLKKANFKGWLLGNIVHIMSFHPVQAKRMLEKFNRIDWLS